MAEKIPQNLANHTRLDPPFHLFALPVMGLLLLASLAHLIFLPHRHIAAVVVLLLAALAVVTLKARLYALKVQDRVIRLEERLRLATLLPEPLRARIPELTEDQLIALRFASDAELPALVERTLKEKLSCDDIKKQIQNWRPDTWRV